LNYYRHCNCQLYCFIYPCKKEDENTDLEIQVDNNSNTVHNNPNEVDNKQISIFSNQNQFRHHTNEFTTNPVLQIIQPTGIQRNSNQLAIIDKNQDFTMNDNGLVTCKFCGKDGLKENGFKTHKKNSKNCKNLTVYSF
jgi:hypothetical protein